MKADTDTTALHSAAAAGDVGTIAVLLDAGADPNSRGSDGDAPLHQATTRRGNIEAITALLDAGADPSLTDRRGLAPLDWAHEHDNTQAVASMLRAAEMTRARPIQKPGPAAQPEVAASASARVRSEHVIACVACIVGYPVITLLALDFGVFDFILPAIQYSLIDLVIDPDPMAAMCRASFHCAVTGVAYFAVPLEIVRRGTGLLTHKPLPTAHPQLPTAVHFVVCLCAVSLVQLLALSLVAARVDIPAFGVPAVLGVLVAAGLATRHSTRVREQR